MEVLHETSTAVLRLFGREPMVEDWRWVGRWAYASAWLAEDRAAAQEMVRCRLRGASRAAAQASRTATGRKDEERSTLVEALAGLPEAFERGTGPYAAVVERAIQEGAERLVADGALLRTATFCERAAFAPRLMLETFNAAMLDVGADRHAMLREVAAQLEEFFSDARGPCPALTTLWLYLQATLSLESCAASSLPESPPSLGANPVPLLALWLQADLALAARRAMAYETAWSAATRLSNDALSRTVAGLTSGTISANSLVGALGDDPWALPLALAITEEPGHAAAVLEIGALAQASRRLQADKETTRWKGQVARVDELERQLGIEVIVPSEAREIPRDSQASANLDLFKAWSVARIAQESRNALRHAIERGVASELTKRRHTARKAKVALQRARETYETALEEARASRVGKEAEIVAGLPDDAGAQRGSAYGIGAGCSVVAAYFLVAAIVGTAGIVGRLAPLAIAVAALPIGAAIVLQVAYVLRRTAAESEASRRRATIVADFELARQAAESVHGVRLDSARELVETAETSLAALENRMSPKTPHSPARNLSRT